MNMKLIGQGNTAEIYALEDGKILKLFREYMSESSVRYEYETALCVQRYMEGVPKAYSTMDVDGRHGIVYDRIIGTDMLLEMQRSPGKIDTYAGQLARLHIGINGHRVTETALPTVKQKLTCDINAYAELPEETKARVLAYMDTLPDGDALCHFDFHPGNVMFQSGEPVIIDWMTACYGDPCADVARTSLLLSCGKLHHASLFRQAFLSLFQKHVLKVYYREYLRNTGMSKADVEKWILPVATARLRESVPESEKKVLLSIIRSRLRGV